MNKTIYIILVGFNTLQEGLDYMTSSPYNFSFIVGGQTYDSLGNPIATPDNPEIIQYGQIYITDNENPAPGDLYIEDGFLKYYKEI